MSENTWRLIDRSNPMLRRRVSDLSPIDQERFVIRLIWRFPPSSIEDLTVRAALASLSANDPVGIDPAKSRELLEVSERLDNEYFLLKEQGETEAVWERKFHESRLAFALHLFYSGVSPDNISVIIYELAHAQDKPDSFLDWADSTSAPT